MGLPTPIVLKILQRRAEFVGDFVVVFRVAVNFIHHLAVAGFNVCLHGGFEGDHLADFDFVPDNLRWRRTMTVPSRPPT